MFLSPLFKTWYTTNDLKEFFDSSFEPSSLKQNKDQDFDWLVQHQKDMGIIPNLDLINAMTNGAPTVLTGQQAMLKGGPMLVFYKAKTAIDEAKRLSKKSGVRVVPVFWIAGDDSDYAEVNIYEEFLISKIEKKDFEEVAGQEVQAYENGYFVKQFASLLQEIFSDQILIVNGGAQEIRERSQAVLKNVVQNSEEIENQLLVKENLLHNNALFPSVKVGQNKSRAFKVVNNKRIRIGHSYSIENEILTHDVLSRPVVADSVFNVVSHVLGPAELSYFLLSEVLYKFLNKPLPAIVSRSHGEVIPNHFSSVLNKYDIEIDELKSLNQKSFIEMCTKLFLDKAELSRTFIDVNSSSEKHLSGESLEKLNRQIENWNEKLRSKLNVEKVKSLDEYNELLKIYSWLGSGRIQERHLTFNELKQNFNWDEFYNNWNGLDPKKQRVKV